MFCDKSNFERTPPFLVGLIVGKVYLTGNGVFGDPMDFYLSLSEFFSILSLEKLRFNYGIITVVLL